MQSRELNGQCCEGNDTADVESIVGRYGVTEVEEGDGERREVRAAGERGHCDQQTNHIYAEVELLVGRSYERELELEEGEIEKRAVSVADERVQGRMNGGRVEEEEGHVVPESNYRATCGSTEAAQQECSLELIGSEVVHEYDVAVVKYESVPWDLYESVPWVSYESVQHNYETIWNGYERITCDYYEKVGDGYQDGYEVFQDGYKVVHNGYEAVGDDYEVVRDDYAVVRDDYEVVRDDYTVVRDDYEVVRDDYNAAQHTYEAVLDGHDEL